MPTYQYRCINCKNEFEVFQKISDSPLQVCPKCKGRIQRIISGGAGFLLKGSGFYTTDYRPDSYKKAAEKEKIDTSPVIKKESAGDKKKELTKGAA
jgi:putative FmdB family regulatory protein